MIKKLFIFSLVIGVGITVLALLNRKEAVFISWEEAKSLFSACQVTSISQAQDLTITLTQKDGTVSYSKSSNIDDLGKALNQSNQNCPNQVQVSID